MSGERVLYGVAGSPGIGMGHALVYREKPMGSLEREVTDVKLELERYHNAVETFCRVTEAKADRVAEMAGKEQGDIIRCQSAMIRDPYLNGQVEGRIASRQSAEEALSASCDLFIDLFTASDDEVTRQRAADVRDLRGAMLRLLLGLPETAFSALKPGTVLLAEELSPSAVSVLNSANVAGIVLVAVLLFVGAGAMMRGLSQKMAREDKLEERDERNRLVELKSKSAAFRLTQAVCFGLMLALLVAGKVTGTQALTAIGTGLAAALSASMLAELGAFYYYEKRT